MSSTSSSSSSPASDRMYSPEQLLKLASSRGSQSTIASLLQDSAQRFAADILLESGDSSAGSSSEEELHEGEEDEEDDDGFVYGQGALRSDLSFEAVEALRIAVHKVLDEPQPQPVPVSVSAARPYVYDHSSTARTRVTATGAAATDLRRGANPYGVFGNPRMSNRPRALSRSRPARALAVPASAANADRESWRAEVSVRRMERSRPTNNAFTREEETQNWRRTEPGSRWTWTENRYEVVKV